MNNQLQNKTNKTLKQNEPLKQKAPISLMSPYIFGPLPELTSDITSGAKLVGGDVISHTHPVSEAVAYNQNDKK